VEFHPAWHALMRMSRAHGVHSERSEVARAVLFYLASQVEAGHGCPLSMTYAAVPALRATPEVAQEWVPRLTARGPSGYWVRRSGTTSGTRGWRGLISLSRNDVSPPSCAEARRASRA